MPPDGDEQLVPGERAAVLQLHGHLAGLACTLDLRDLGLGHDLGALFAQASGDLLGGPRLFLGQQLRAARQECHLRPKRCIGLGPGKTGAELAEAVRAGVSRVHVESPHELYGLGAAARAAGRAVDVLLRVNLAAPEASALPLPVAGSGDTLLMGGTPSPFGMNPASLDRCAGLLADGSLEPGLVRLRGLHAHLASGLDAATLLGAAGRVLDFGRRWCARRGVTQPEFNLGGGMVVRYQRPQALFDWDGYGRGLAGLARPGETLRIEPGRSVTAYCGEVFAVVAGGTHHLRTPVAKGHSQPFAVIPVAAWTPCWPRPGVAAEPVTIAGQLCTPKDVLARRVPVRRLRAGDLVAFGLAGAYAWNISHHDFLMHPPPGFHYLAGHGGERS